MAIIRLSENVYMQLFTYLHEWNRITPSIKLNSPYILRMDEIQQIIKELLETDENVKLCILYGSTASGRLRNDSDLDIAIAGDTLFRREYLLDLQLALSRRLGYDVDVAEMKNLKGLILSEILRKGEVLIKKDTGFYAEFIKKGIYFNEDVLHDIRMILKKRAESFVRVHLSYSYEN